MVMPLTRLPGETRLEQVRRMRTYEHWRADFEVWILDEGRTHSWIATKIGKSRQTVVIMAQALEIYTRKSTEVQAYIARAMNAPAKGEEAPPVRPTTVNATLEEVVQCERNFQVMRLAYCSAWDRGW